MAVCSSASAPVRFGPRSVCGEPGSDRTVLPALPIPIKLWLPDYGAAVGPGRVLVAALFYKVVARMPAVVLVSLNRQRTLLLVTALSIGISACAVIAAIVADENLVAVAVASSSGYFTYSTLAMVAALRAVRIGPQRAVRFAGLTRKRFGLLRLEAL